MKTLFALFVSLTLIGMMASPGSQTQACRLNHQRTNWCVVENENYAFWDKSFDRYASYWMDTFQDNLPKEIHSVDRSQMYQTRSEAQPELTSEAKPSWARQAQTSLHSYRTDRPKASKPKE